MGPQPPANSWARRFVQALCICLLVAATLWLLISNQTNNSAKNSLPQPPNTTDTAISGRERAGSDTSSAADASTMLAHIAGVVVDGWGHSIAASIVTATRISDQTTDSIGELGVVPGPVPPIPATQTLAPNSTTTGAISDLDGRFYIALPRAGRYLLSAFHPDYLAASLAPISIKLGDLRNNIVLVAYEQPTLDAGNADIDAANMQTITGRVLSPRGKGLGNARVVAHDKKLPVAALTEGSGTFRIEVPASTKLHVSHPDYPGTTILAQPDAPIEVQLSYGGGIDGLVRDRQTLQPIAKATITAKMKTHKHRHKTKQDGVVKLVPLQPGTWHPQHSGTRICHSNHNNPCPHRFSPPSDHRLGS